MKPATQEQIDKAISKMVRRELPRVLRHKKIDNWSTCGIDLETPEGQLTVLRLAESLPERK